MNKSVVVLNFIPFAYVRLQTLKKQYTRDLTKAKHQVHIGIKLSQVCPR